MCAICYNNFYTSVLLCGEEVFTLHKKQWFSVLSALTYLTQVGLSIATPLVLCLLGAWWLNARFGVGEWIFIVGIVLGLGGGVSSFVSFARYFQRKNK